MAEYYAFVRVWVNVANIPEEKRWHILTLLRDFGVTSFKVNDDWTIICEDRIYVCPKKLNSLKRKMNKLKKECGIDYVFFDIMTFSFWDPTENVVV